MNQKALFDLQPKEGAPLDDWVKYSQRLRERIEAMDDRYEKAIQDAKTLRKELTNKNSANIYYKRRITELESTIENIKSNKYYRSVKWVLGRFAICKRTIRKVFVK